jgi:hypothetical protein
MECLILRFKGAGIFNPKWSKDKVFDAAGMHDRKTFGTIDVPVGCLSKRHISNVLHVLMGERPAPSIRASFIKPIESIRKLADGARVKIDSLITLDKKGNKHYLKETKTVRKSIPNCWNTASHSITLNGINKPLKGETLSWELIKVYLGDVLYQSFLKLVKTCIGDSALKERVEDVIGLLSSKHNSAVRAFIAECSEACKEPMAHLLRGSTEAAAFNQSSDVLVRRTVCKGVEEISRIDGTIYVPMSNKDLDRVRKGPGSATILEGGVVFIEGVDDFSDNLISDTLKPVE